MKPLSFPFTVEKVGSAYFVGKSLASIYYTLPVGEYITTISKRKKTRSLNENKYYWGVIIPLLGDYCGYDKDEMHDALKWKFLQVDGIKPGMPPTVRSTSDLSTIEFEQLMSTIRMWASKELGVYVPSPNEPDLDLYMQNL